MNRLLFLILLLLPLAARADVANWKIDPAHSSISFDDTQSGQPFTGGFKKFDGKITFDPDHLDQSHAKITIDTHSAFAGGEGDEYIQAPEWFNAAKFPAAIFETTGFAQTGPDQFTAHGKLTIRDVTLPLDLPFSLTFSPDGRAAHMQGMVTLNRLYYHLGTGSWADPKTAGVSVPVHINVTATRAP